MYLVKSSLCEACDEGKYDGPRYDKKNDYLTYRCNRCGYTAHDLPRYRRTGDIDTDRMILNGILEEIMIEEEEKSRKKKDKDEF